MSNPFDETYDRYLEDVQRITREVLARDVWPLLKRRRYRLLAGMGTFYLEDRNGKQLWTDPSDYPNDPDFKRVLEILNTDIPGVPECLGAFGPDFPTK